MPTQNPEALSLDGGDGSDYVLKDSHESCWVTVGNIAVYIKRGSEGVSVSLYPSGAEAESDCLDHCYADYR